jgi:acetoacetyl-CoA reductase
MGNERDIVYPIPDLLNKDKRRSLMQNGNGYGSLNGRVALVTGAAKGIGRAIAQELACRGAAIAINYRSSREEAESLAQRIEENGGHCLLVPGDVANKGEARAVVKAVLEGYRRIDILVNNAGITRDATLRKMTDDDWADVINVNLNGTYYCTSAALPWMIEQKFGRIINISSFVGQAGNFGQTNYAASKGGIIAFTKALALEMAKYNITANAVAPGFTCTDMLDKVPANILEQIKAKIPMQRFAQPEEIATAVAFLAADASYITGQQININGGLYM